MRERGVEVGHEAELAVQSVEKLLIGGGNVVTGGNGEGHVLILSVWWRVGRLR